MKEFWIILAITFLFLLLAFVGIGIKILLKKEGKFEGTCASMNPETNPDGDPCQFCGRTPDEYKGNCSREILKKIIEQKEQGKQIFDWDEINRKF
jgi:hypothetical protein